MARIFLALNGKQIKSLDDLKANFNAKQVLGFYKVKRLQAWLEEQGLTEILENIHSFEEGLDDETLLSMLMAVFELDDAKIAEVEEQIKEQEAAEKAAAEEKEKQIQTTAVLEESSSVDENASSSHGQHSDFNEKNDEDDSIDEFSPVKRIAETIVSLLK
ncbi:MAG: hypothetical protein MJ033_00380 [Victivallaceae bacterium]|nr:hypothetical protein [Victivallaceae bacterium]